jgi:hypothetical protein
MSRQNRHRSTESPTITAIAPPAQAMAPRAGWIDDIARPICLPRLPISVRMRPVLRCRQSISAVWCDARRGRLCTMEQFMRFALPASRKPVGLT